MSGKKLPTFFATFDFTTIFVNSRPLQKRDSHHIFPTLAPRYPLSSFLPFVLLLFFRVCLLRNKKQNRDKL